MQGNQSQTPLGTDEDRYRLLVESIVDYAVFMLTPDGIVASWNAGAQRIEGYEAAEIIGQHFSRFYTPEDRAAGLPVTSLARAAREGRFEAEGWRLRKDGIRFWAHIVVHPIHRPQGTLVGFATITHDLTERRSAQTALSLSEEQFSLLVHSVTDYAIYMLDTEGRVSSWNIGAQRIKGYEPGEIIGEHFSRFYIDEERNRGEPQRGLGIAASEGRFEKEGWRVRKDGTRFWASVVIDAIRDPGGKVIGFAKITRDITEKMETHRALETAREELFQAQKLEAIGQLTGGVAHDFNNLLMVILSSLDLLRKRMPSDEKTASLLNNAFQAAQRGASLTQRMLAFARRQELDRRPVDLPDLVRGMNELLEGSIGPSITIETRFPLSLPKVYTDANQLESALLNLAINARDAMPDGGTITIAARVEDIVAEHPTSLEPGRYVCFSVQDAGEGMDETRLARAIDPFFTTKGVGKGTGLGLPMVQGIAEQSGGRFVLKSTVGVGTTAEIWLQAAEEAPQSRPDVDSAPAWPAAGSRPLQVLAVDDDVLVLMNTAAMLEDLGHTALEAGSAQEALKILRQEPAIDLVVTDQAMPNMTGVQLAEAIRGEWPDLPVILATGYAELPDGLGSQLPKLAKPFGQVQLEQVISRAIEEGSSSGGRVIVLGERTLDGRQRLPRKPVA